MPNDFESHHTRSVTGTFACRKTLLPDIDFSDFSRPVNGDRALSEFADGARITTVTPSSVEDLCEALSASVPVSGVTQVRVQHAMAKLTGTRVQGPSDGKPLLVDISAGAGSMWVESGYVVVRVDSPYSTDIHVVGSSEVTVIVARGRTAVITAEDRASVFVIAENGARGAVHVRSAQVTTDVTGDSTRFHIANTFTWDV